MNNFKIEREPKIGLGLKLLGVVEPFPKLYKETDRTKASYKWLNSAERYITSNMTQLGAGFLETVTSAPLLQDDNSVLSFIGFSLIGDGIRRFLTGGHNIHTFVSEMKKAQLDVVPNEGNKPNNLI